MKPTRGPNAPIHAESATKTRVSRSRSQSSNANVRAKKTKKCAGGRARPHAAPVSKILLYKKLGIIYKAHIIRYLIAIVPCV